MTYDNAKKLVGTSVKARVRVANIETKVMEGTLLCVDSLLWLFKEEQIFKVVEVLEKV